MSAPMLLVSDRIGDAAVHVSMAKRAFDVVVATILLVAVLPMLGLIALVVAATSPGPVLFRQPRYGRGGRMFTMLKFRTMRTDAEDELARLLEEADDLAAEMRGSWKLQDDPRVTPFGRLLRRLSLDELPQLVNVVRGDMSLVGPRPRWCEDELGSYGPHLTEYFTVKPGLTGPWQVQGRNTLAERERVRLDLEYVRTRSFWGDVRLLLRTIPVLLRPGRNGAC